MDKRISQLTEATTVNNNDLLVLEQSNTAKKVKGSTIVSQLNTWSEYNASTSYVVGNKVTWQGASYVCKVDCQGVAPSDTSKWMVFASSGAKIVSTVLVGQDQQGGNIYEQTFDNGATARFTAPKGDVGGVSSVNTRTGAVTGLEEASNKVTTMSASSTDTQYPSAKAVYDKIHTGTFGESSGGKNLFDYNTALVGVSWDRLLQQTRTSVFVNVSGSTTYTVSRDNLNGYNFTRLFELDSSNAIVVENSSIPNITFTTRPTTAQLCFLFDKTGGASVEDIASNKIQLELGSTATTYEPYIKSNLQMTADGEHIKGLGNAIGMRGWNQLANHREQLPTQTVNGITFTNNGNGTFTLNGTATANAYIQSGHNVIVNHKYLAVGCPQGGSSSTYYMQFNSRDSQGNPSIGLIDVGNGGIFTALGSGSAIASMVVENGFTVSNKVFTPQLFDLTALFGSGNEPTSVADFRAMFPAEYYGYHNNVNSLADLNFVVVSTWT